MSRLQCGCIPDASGFGYCNKCTKALRKKIWHEMSEEKKEYDRTFAPRQSLDLDIAEFEDEIGCSCHINPPCSYCVGKGEGDE